MYQDSIYWQVVRKASATGKLKTRSYAEKSFCDSSAQCYQLENSKTE
ncbi:hypothetical protein GXM_09587 [Nostoc sphaeroides CCNUC1]|uniref:Uncharacterized protein n=1 Tax=Nostoc sphaeroides CCNUC1 TaxID=2653204 RepID=A0A5P8WGY3_9NOSO|nr:hypothetical protein GXM_09060 [Nostoc sphaeroides CCNUC1]QFS52093.1 hypothetical protein GXM_09587 [Nostoc sphaeroides CCNUC1]